MPQYPVEPDYNLLYYWRMLVRAKRMILFIVLVALGLTAVYTKTQPKLYESKAVLLPAREETIAAPSMSTGGAAGAVVGAVAAAGLPVP